MQSNNMMDPNIDASPRNSREMEKDIGSIDQLHQRLPERERQDIYR